VPRQMQAAVHWVMVEARTVGMTELLQVHQCSAGQAMLDVNAGPGSSRDTLKKGLQ
jgi:hypothetical protein